MDSSQLRIQALQKSYDDRILNTSNETAAKVLVADRKAQGLEHELQVTNDESVRLMLRRKKMMDDKISEAKIASWKKQETINELEAQLEEAEDIVSELRDSLVGSNKENLCLNQRNEYPKCCAQAMQMRSLYGPMPEFPSILRRSKEQKEAAVCKDCCTKCRYEVQILDLIRKTVKTAADTKNRKKRIASSKKIPNRLFRKLHETPVLVPQSDPKPKSVNEGDIERLNSKAERPVY